MWDAAAIYALGSYAIAAIAKAITPDNPAEQVGGGVIGNWSDRILLQGLRGSRHAWRCFRSNCRRLDPGQNHILFRALIAAHWRAVAQAIAVYGRARGLTLSTAADSLPLPQTLRDAAARLKNESQPLSLGQQADREMLRQLVKTCDERAAATSVEVAEGWDAVLDPLYDDLTALMAQNRHPSCGPAEKAWQALVAEFPALGEHSRLRQFFVEYWFEFFAVNFQLQMQDPQVAPLLTGKLFAEIREREGGPAIDSQRLMTAVETGFSGMHEHMDRMEAKVAAIQESLGRRQRAPVREPVIGLLNTHQQIVGRDEEARALLDALRVPGPALVSLTAPPGFGKSALLARVVALAMPGLNPAEAGLEGLAVLDARQELPTMAALASLLGRITGWQETAARFQETSTKAVSGGPLRTLFFDFLRQAGPLWLVIENAERALLPETDPEFRALLQAWCEFDHNAKLILLSRQALNPAPVCHRRLPRVEEALRRGLPAEQAAAVLRRRLEDTRFAGAREDLLRKVAVRLHGVPLALVQFAGYLRAKEAGIELDDRFVESSNLLRLFDPEQMQDSIERVVGEHLRMLDAGSRRLVGLVAWAGLPVPRSGLLAVAGEEGATLLTRLARSGLLEEIAGTAAEGLRFGMHPLLQEFVEPKPADELEAEAWMRAAEVDYDHGRIRPAGTLWTLAERVLRRLVKVEGRGELASDLASVIVNKGVALSDLGRLEAAVAAYDEATGIFHRLVEVEGRGELANNLASAIMNKGNALRNLGRVEDALAAYDEAIGIRRRLVEVEGRGELASYLAGAIMNKGDALLDLGRLEAAVAASDEAIGIYRRLVEGEGRGELASDLAIALFNLALAREEQKLPTTLAAAREAREIWERLVHEGLGHLGGKLENARKLEARLRG